MRQLTNTRKMLSGPVRSVLPVQTELNFPFYLGVRGGLPIFCCRNTVRFKELSLEGSGRLGTLSLSPGIRIEMELNWDNMCPLQSVSTGYQGTPVSMFGLAPHALSRSTWIRSYQFVCHGLNEGMVLSKSYIIFSKPFGPLNNHILLLNRLQADEVDRWGLK